MLPLADYEVLSSRDLDQARERVGSELCPHALWVVGEPAAFHARLHAARVGSVGLHYLAYGAGVRLAHEHVDDSYALVVPLAGATLINADHEEAVAAASTAVIVSPKTQLMKEFGPGSHRLLVWFGGSTLETTLGQLLGRPEVQPLRFDLRVNLATPRGRGYLELLTLARHHLEHGTGLVSSPLASHHLQQLLVTELLLLAGQNYSAQLHGHSPAAAIPRRVRHARDMIEAHAGEPLTVEEIAAASGVGVRSLQQEFRTYLDTTPMAYLRRVRLARAHEQLLTSAPEDVSVSQIALRWGFIHLSRFAAAYRATYGETPSTTLHRAASTP